MATEVKFTSGPWFFEVKPNFGECYVRTGQQPEGGQLYICALPTDSKKNVESRAELDANGFLIAAAPDLYEALSDVIRPYGIADIAINNTAGSDLDAFLELYRRIQAALNKANPSPA